MSDITQFLAIFAQNLTILPQNITFYDLFSLAIYTIVYIYYYELTVFKIVHHSSSNVNTTIIFQFS